MPRRRSMRMVSTQKALVQKVLHIWQSMRTVPTSAALLHVHEAGRAGCTVAAMGGKPGDLLLFAADKDKVVFDCTGKLTRLVDSQDSLTS